MKLRKRTIWRGLALLALVVLAAGLVAPHLSVNRMERRVRQSLEAALGRQVELGEVHLNLFNGPGFSVSRVIIHEDPNVSREPLAYIESLEARVSFRSLWAGRLEFSNLRLNEPSINLAKPAAGPWNFEPLLSGAVGAAARQPVRFPSLQVRGGRINFRFGDVKSEYYFTGPEVDIWPPSAPDGYWGIRFSGEAARTDRAARGFGRFAGRGRWRPDPRTGGQVDLSLELENSPIAELVTLLHGHDIGVHGQVSSRATLSGPASAIQVSGRLEVRDIHRWDLLAPRGQGWPLDYRGRLDLIAQRLELESFSTGETAPPLKFWLRASDYLSQPRWGVIATFQELPLAPLLEVARHMGVALLPGLTAEGDLAGVMGYSPAAGLQGKVACPEATIKTPDADGLRLQRAELVVEQGRIHLLPAALRTAQNEQATLEAEYSRSAQTLEGRLQASAMRVAGLRAGLAALVGGVPLLENCQEGSWQGRLTYRSRGGQPGQWSGAFEISDARMDLAGLAEPLQIKRARAVLRDGGAVMDRIQAQAGRIEFQGQYRYAPQAARPHHVQLSIPRLEAADLERLLAPTLRRQEGLLARTLRLGRARIPPWLAQRHLEGALEIGSAKLGELTVERLRARLRWDGAEAELDSLEAHLADGSLKGRLAVDLSRAAPLYRLAAQLPSLAWSGGQWEAEGALETQGTGAELWRNLRAHGSFGGRSVDLGAEAALESVSGSFELRVARGAPRLRLADLEANFGEELLRGQGATQEDGRLHLELSDGRRAVRATVTLVPLQLVWQRPGSPH